MTEANQHVKEDRMHPDYLKKEQAFREKAARLWDQERQLREGVRSRVGAEPEARQEAYMKGYQQLEERHEQLVEEINQEHSKRTAAAEKKLYAGTGERFGGYLVELSSKPADELEGIMRTAQRTGQKDLARAVAVAALDKNQFGVFDQWAASDPETAEALKYLRTTPGGSQFYDRTTRAMRPPKADPASLEPTAEDLQRFREEEARRNAPRQQFFHPNRPRYQVGGRRW